MTNIQHSENTPAAATAPSNLYGTETDPDLQRHHWQQLGLMVVGRRPEWSLMETMESLWSSRKRQSFAELARTALAVAADRTFTDPSAIRMAAAGVIEL